MRCKLAAILAKQSGNIMTKARAVIGANYGNEGIGSVVSHLCKETNATTVVRFNGADQARNRPYTKGLYSKILASTYSSGTIQGAQTYISRYALFNPLSAREEKQFLASNYFEPQTLVVHPDSQIITPFDIVLNRFLERGRGDDAHGTTGKGVGEAMRRINSSNGPKITAKQIQNPTELFKFTVEIRAWFKSRIKEEAKKGSFTYLNDLEKESLFNLIELRSQLLSQLYLYSAAIQMFDVAPILHCIGKTDTVIFEGAQGLLLDQDNKEHFPHVTYSKTGLDNVLLDCGENNLELTDVYFVTRPYLTRHGKGLILAGEECANRWGEDFTLKSNIAQGDSRYAEMYWPKLIQRIHEEAKKVSTPGTKFHIALTHLDQVEDCESLSITEEICSLTNFDIIAV
jgi:adenylosuccinate synthase